MRIVLLRLSDIGEPIVSCSYGKGVLTLPSLPPLKDKKPSDPMFTVKLVIAAGCTIARDGLIWTNCPQDAHTKFDRHRFSKKVIKASFHQDCFINLDVYSPGSYCYYFSFRNEDEQLETTKKFYFVVPPVLYLHDEFLPLNSINSQSVISKWMGKDWDKIFQKIANKGYNMVHFTPLQHRGESNSPYSIYDQLEFDPSFFRTKDDVAKMVQKLYNDYNILSLTDVVFNHTANNSAWLREHPESGYNHETAPHLTAAIELDEYLLNFSKVMKQQGYPTDLKTTEDLLKIMDGLKIHVLGSLKLWEYYVVDIKTALSDIKRGWNNYTLVKFDIPKDIQNNLPLLAEYIRENATCTNFGSLSHRFSNKVDLKKFISILKLLYGMTLTEDVLEQTKKILDELNLPLYIEYDDDVKGILEQLYSRIKYLRIDEHGPQLGPITPENPLTEPYFTRFIGNDGKPYALANNGWIWNGNPLIDFASVQSKAFLRREVIVWSDCVKLRYGSKPSDSPYLWEKMSKYVEINANIFHGFRIDNCHSTPLHVGEYFLDLARTYNPNLYVVAELFSGSESMDCLFVERLGISSLIREAMQAWSVEELSRLIHRHGGRPIGSYKSMPLDDIAYPVDNELHEEICDFDYHRSKIRCVSEIKVPKFLTATPPHALFMDCTHDNEMPYQKRTVEDTLPNAALVALCSSAIGSVYGYDEIFPALLDVVKEARIYSVIENDGISKVKLELNKIRKLISHKCNDFEDSEMHLHQDGQYITFHRNNANNGDGWFLIARTKFYDGDIEQKIPKIKLSNSTCEFLFSYSLVKTGNVPVSNHVIKGIPTELKEIHGFRIEYDEKTGNSVIIVPDYFPQGSIAMFKTKQNEIDDELENFMTSGALKASENLDLYSINSMLYRCEAEELDTTGGKSGIYNIPNYGNLNYCGLQGWVTVLRNVVFNNDLIHPLSEHLRTGFWALDYVVSRLDYYADGSGIQEMQAWMKSRMIRLKLLPYYLVPKYFALIIGIAYQCCRYRGINQMSHNIRSSTLFVQNLGMVSIQMVSKMLSTSLLPNESVPCMAAGLPHFSSQYMRCWGRDVFISLRGLFLTSGRFDDARLHILAFAKTLKHGLIPNLLDSGRNPRYNSRDAVWFFLQSIQDYVMIAPNGENILKDKVSRRFPLNDKYISVGDPEAFSYDSTIEEIIYEILMRHAKGIKYREANAGPNLDRVMKDEGFNVEIYVDWSTGLIHGGSQWNCGTWMDKMGESELAMSKGFPGTPRDGAAVEINGLLKSALRFIIQLQRRGIFKYESVETSDGNVVSFEHWNELLLNNFEKKFYIPTNKESDSDYDVDYNLVNRRGIYKDLYRSGKAYEDYQLRPNFCIAMVVAPELFTPEYAVGALNIAEKVICGPVGMRTLDPSDYNYRPYYKNGEDSSDFYTAKGRNYHQGPEWVWCYGYFLRAYTFFHFLNNPKAQNFTRTKPSSYLYQKLYKLLDAPRKWIFTSSWSGLTELTNKDGEFCEDSSPTQAWSSGCLLDLFYDLWSRFEEHDSQKFN